ncbi:MAG: RNA chaperone Hfq [Oscillospiraceae bacterium]|nr:RNA chaperone Hfq [Oscillospiraceae bacterium]
MDKNVNLQDVFLNEARKARTPVTVFLMNGFQLRGTIASFDSFMLKLEAEGKQHYIYKHAISTITPTGVQHSGGV